MAKVPQRNTDRFARNRYYFRNSPFWGYYGFLTFSIFRIGAKRGYYEVWGYYPTVAAGASWPGAIAAT